MCGVIRSLSGASPLPYVAQNTDYYEHFATFGIYKPLALPMRDGYLALFHSVVLVPVYLASLALTDNFCLYRFKLFRRQNKTSIVYVMILFPTQRSVRCIVTTYDESHCGFPDVMPGECPIPNELMFTHFPGIMPAH